MIQAVGKVVHTLMPPTQAYEYYLTLKGEHEQALKRK
jgi:hypothetical protein